MESTSQSAHAVNWRTSLMGNLEAFVLGESFDDYLERVNNYFELNVITDETYKIRLLLHRIGPVASAKLQKLANQETSLI